MSQNLRFITIIILTIISFKSQATLIEYDLSHVAGNVYQYEYTITNNSIVTGFQEFTIYFNEVLYDNLTMPTTNSIHPDWDPLVIQPDPHLPDVGFLDGLSFGAPLGLNESITGFIVEFEWLGNGLPGSQYFDIYDIFFNRVDFGFTSIADSGPTTISEPNYLLLMMLGFLGLIMRKRYKVQ